MYRAHDFPDPSACRTLYISKYYWQCLTRDAGDCRYALRFGSERFCKHSENYGFSEEYKKEVNR